MNPPNSVKPRPVRLHRDGAGWNRPTRINERNPVPMTTVPDPRPSTRPCPSWCTAATAAIHECTSAPLVVPQSLNPSLLVDTAGVGVWALDDVHLTLEQAYGDPEPHLVACWRDGNVRAFSLKETEQFIARATALLALASVSHREVAA